MYALCLKSPLKSHVISIITAKLLLIIERPLFLRAPLKEAAIFSVYLCSKHWLIGYDSHSIFLTVGEVGAQRGSVPPNGSLCAGKNKVP